MKKRKIFSYLFLGLLTVGSTGMVTSCKDYDDDIDQNKADIQSLQTALKSCQDECQTNIASLKSQLETQTATINQLTTQLNTLSSSQSETAKSLASEIERATGQEASLAARINTLETTVNSINDLLAGKVDKSVYDATVADIYSKIQSVDTNLGSALTRVSTLETQLTSVATTANSVKSDLEQQVAALDLYKQGIESRLSTLEKGLSTEELQAVQTKVDAAKSELQTKIDNLAIKDIDGLQAALDGKVSTETYRKLQQTVNDAVKSIDKLQASVDVLNILVSKSLRGLVFVPQAYYYGIEATSIKVLSFKEYLQSGANSIQPAAYNKVEEASLASATHRYAQSADQERVLDFVASYHMNPSSADTTKFGKLSIIADDEPYVTDTRAAAAGAFTVKSWKAEGGDLNVNIKVNDPTKIKTVSNDQAVTVFALQVNTNKQGADTTITSDYATLYKKSVKDLKIYHTTATASYNTAATDGNNANAVTGHQDHGQLMQAVAAAKTNAPQDLVQWNQTIDLANLVEVHYTDVDGTTKVLSAAELAANGLQYKFELTGFYGEDPNVKTSESAHAAIKNSILKPQAPKEDGSQATYDEGVQNREKEAGRTPLVRVELIDTENGNKILDYGYIRLQITNTTVTPENTVISLNPDTPWSYQYNGECTDPAKAWSWKNTWANTEYVIYSDEKVQLSREEFEDKYEPDVDGGYFVQYQLKNGEFVKATTTYGTVQQHNETTLEPGTQTQVVEWNVPAATMKAYYVDANNKAKKVDPMTVYIKYAVKAGKSGYPIYLKLTQDISKIKVTDPTTPAGTTNLAGLKISNYWYAENGGDAAWANTLTPEDNENGTAEVLDNQFSDLFTGNLGDQSKLINVTVDNTANKEYAANKLNLNFVFDGSNAGKTVKGNLNGTETVFTLGVADNGKSLTARSGNTTETIATISTDPDIAKQVVALNKNSEFGKAILNYKGRSEITADGTLKAVIGLVATNKGCAKPLSLSQNTFDMRFIRPINVFNANKSIIDATNKLERIGVAELVKFTDWRGYWNGTRAQGGYTAGSGYTKYYGIESITIPGVSNGANIADNDKVVTNLGQTGGKEVALNTVSKQVQFTYNNGEITYRNLSSNVNDFYVKIPVAVNYIWGTIYTDVTITVSKTDAQAKRH